MESRKIISGVAATVRSVDTHDIIGVAGFSALVYGVSKISAPAAWITGGVLLLALFIWAAWPRSAKGN